MKLNITSTYSQKSDLLTLRYDKKDRNIFRVAALEYASIYHAGEWDLNALAIDPQQSFELQHGIQILDRLGQVKSVLVQTTGHEVRLALNAAIWSTIFLISKGKPVDGAHSVLLLLASIAPVDILTVALPSADDVLGRNFASNELLLAYEVVRAAGPDGIARIPMLQAVELSQVLRRLPKQSKAIKDFLDLLEISTASYLCALVSLGTSHPSNV